MKKIDHRILYDTKALLKKNANKICGSSKTAYVMSCFLLLYDIMGKY